MKRNQMKRRDVKRGPAGRAEAKGESAEAKRPSVRLATAAGERYQLVADFTPQGDQPRAIEALTAGVKAGTPAQVLLGVTGSGKTFTMAHVIASVHKPALVIAPNKTLAAQLYHEFKSLFPNNAVRYFVSYYDYYQPEAYVPSTDTYIEKDSSINDEIDKMRHSATKALLERRDVIIVASVSCIYGLGSPEAYFDMLVFLERGGRVDRDQLLRKLVDIQYERNDYDFHRGTFRVRGDVVEIFPAYEEARALRIEFFGDEIERIAEIDPLRGTTLRVLEAVAIYPALRHQARSAQARRRRHPHELRSWQTPRAGPKPRGQRPSSTMYDLELLEMGRPSIETTAPSEGNLGRGPPPPTSTTFPTTTCRSSTSYDGAVDRRHVSRRPPAQGDAGRVRFRRRRRSDNRRSASLSGRRWRTRWCTSGHAGRTEVGKPAA
jgi:excinuclease ABC subunit B